MRRFLSPCAIITVLLIICGEACFWGCTDPLSGAPILEPSADVGTVVCKHRLLDDVAGGIVLVGDSSCMMGLIPDLVSKEPHSCMNLGTLSSFTLAGVETLAKEAIEGAVKPRAVVVAVLPQTLEVSAKQAETFGLVGPYLLAFGQRSVSYAPSIQDWHKWIFRKHQIGRFPDEFGGALAVFQERLAASRGYFEEPGSYDGTITPRTSVELSGFSLAAINSIADTCRQHRIPLIFWLSPVPADSVDHDYLQDTRMIAQTVGANQSIRVARDGAPAWDPDLFGSVTHLTRQGAERNSTELACYLASIHLLPNMTDSTIANPAIGVSLERNLHTSRE